MGNRADILKAVGMPQNETVEVKEWKQSVTLRPLTVGEWLEAFEEKDSNKSALRVLACAIIDDGGKQVFTYEDLDSFPADQQTILGRLFNIARRMNGDLKQQKKY